jgi:hypothetical protein
MVGGMAAKKVKGKKSPSRKSSKLVESQKRSRAARKGWKTRRAKEAVLEERKGFEVVALALAIFRPIRGKDRAKWDGRRVLGKVVKRIERQFDSVSREFPGLAGAFAPVEWRGSWRAEIPFRTGLTYDKVRVAIESVEGAGIDLEGGRLHIGLIMRDQGYAPISDAVSDFEMALANAGDSLAQGVTRYAPIPSIEMSDIEESVEAELEREEKAAARKRAAFRRTQEREKMKRRRARKR